MLPSAAARKARIPALPNARNAAALPAGAVPQEQELKLLLHPQDIAVLRARLDALAPSRSEQIDSIYLDTPDRRLAGARAALRLRALGQGRRKRWMQTLKTDDSGAAFSVRGEWETAAPGGRLQPSLLADSPLLQLLTAGGVAQQDGQGRHPGGASSRRAVTPGAARAIKPSAGLAPVFRTRFDRSTWDLAVYGAHIEVVIDVGVIEAGAASEPILEAELELKSGPSAAIWRLALDLCGSDGRHRRADLGLLPYGDSKAARGYRLALGRSVEPRAARRASDITATHSAGAAARLLVANEMIPLLANAIGLQTGTDSEFVHQSRVTLRRMRAGLDVLGAALPAALERGLQCWGERFGAVRDWDVLCEQLLPQIVAEQGSQHAGGWARVTATAERRRHAATLRLRRQLTAPPFAELMLRLLQWSATPASAPNRPVGDLAAKAVNKRLRSVAKAAQVYSRCSPQRQHRIRLQAKTVRYAMELFSDVLAVKRHRAARRALARFQDAAGRAQDAWVTAAAIERLTRSRILRRDVAAWARARRQKSVEKAQRFAARLSVWR